MADRPTFLEPDGLTPSERAEVRKVFARHGFNEAIHLARQLSPDEVLFVVDSTSFFRIGESVLTHDLMAVLPGRKVWVGTEGPEWNGQLVTLGQGGPR
jgi:hypothetical protein